MKALNIILLVLAAAFPGISAAAGAPTESPHAEAIRLVMQVRGREIQALEQPSGGWHDTAERTWSAKRPFGPGIVDSTHFFHVSYAVDGRVVATWSVNTRTGQVADPGESIRIE